MQAPQQCHRDLAFGSGAQDVGSPAPRDRSRQLGRRGAKMLDPGRAPPGARHPDESDARWDEHGVVREQRSLDLSPIERQVAFQQDNQVIKRPAARPEPKVRPIYSDAVDSKDHPKIGVGSLPGAAVCEIINLSSDKSIQLAPLNCPIIPMNKPTRAIVPMIKDVLRSAR